MSRRILLSRGLVVLVLLVVGAGFLAGSFVSAEPDEAQALPLGPNISLPPYIMAVSPAVASVSPQDGDTDVVYDPVISVTFDQTMDPSTMSWGSFYLERSDNSLVSSTLKYSTDGLGWYLYPADPLEPGVTYKVTVTVAARGTNGMTLLAPMTWSFTTVLFTDVSSENPYAVAISHLAASRIIGGFADNSFRPGQPVKRMQFAKMISLLMGFHATANDVCPFADVPGGLDPNDPLYPDHYVAAAFAQGVIKGKTATSFAPYDPINRFQLISMVVRALQARVPGLLQTPPNDYVSAWDPAMSPDHGQNARLAEYNHLLSGIPVAGLDPWDPMPRGEVAQLLSNIPW